MEEIISKSMFKKEFKRMIWFSLGLFIIMLIIFNVGPTLLIGKGGRISGFDLGYGVKKYISLSALRMLLLAVAYLFVGNMLMNNRAKYLKEEAFKGSKRITYVITEAAILAATFCMSFLAAFLLKLIAYAISLKSFMDAGIGFSYLLSFFVLHMVFILFMTALILLINSLFGKFSSATFMPLVSLYSFFLTFGTGYFVISHEHAKTIAFLEKIDSLTINKIYQRVISDYRILLDENRVLVLAIASMLLAALLMFGLAILSYRYMKTERVGRWFLYYWVEALVMIPIIITCAIYLAIMTGAVMVLLNNEVEVLKAWNYSYRFIWLYALLAVGLRIVYLVIKNRAWSVFQHKGLEEATDK